MTSNLMILLKKNLILEKREWTWTLFELVIIIACYTIIVINPAVNPRNYQLELDEAKRTQFYENQSNLYDLSAFMNIKNIHGNRRLRYGLIFAPLTNFTKIIIESTSKALGFHQPFPVSNESQIFNYFNEKKFLAGVYFHNCSADMEYVPEQLSISLSFPSEFRTNKHREVFHRLWLTRCTGVLDEYDADDQLKHTDLYLREGFLQIQHRIFIEWLKMLRGDTKKNANGSLDNLLPLITVNSLRHHTDHEPCHTESTTNIIWFLYYFTFFVPFLRVLKRFSQERENNIHAQHWIYGYENGHHWIAHFMVSFVHLLIMALIVISFLTIEWTTLDKCHIFRHINPLILLLFIVLYIAMLLIYSMIVATLFVNTSNCLLFGTVMWLGTYGLFSLVLDSTEEFSTPLVISLLLFFNNFFPYGMRLMKNINVEGNDTHLWSLIYTEIGNIFLLLIFLTLIDFIRPGRYRRRSYFNFLFIPYWCLKCLRKNKSQAVITMNEGMESNTISRMTLSGPSSSLQNFECGPVRGQEILHIKDVCTYHNGIHPTQQLKNITMKFYKNEVTVILGHHGTGKTRLISMLAGWQKPDAGSISYNVHYDIYKHWLNYRRRIDVSMPNNPLFEKLSVCETLKYFCEIKHDASDTDALALEMEVKKWQIILKPHIPDCYSVIVKHLNFSQKRLLALCCTLCCNRSIILLDEPTVHMLRAEQFYYWQILQLEKQNRCIIVTTFSIDEADAIGDRIAILNEGSLVAYGSPFFLKTRFGIGFDLIVLKDPNTSAKPITELINQYIPNIEPNKEIGDQLIYKLPSNRKDAFQRMLIHLEKLSISLGIQHIRMTGSQLSEVYMTLGLGVTSNTMVSEIRVNDKNFKIPKRGKLDINRQQINAMLFKKMIHQAPNVIPIVMIFGVFLLILFINEMTKRIRIPSAHNKGIHLGLSINATSRGLLDDFRNCSFVEIIETLSAQYQTKLNNKPKLFLFKHFECGKQTYKLDILDDMGIYDKLGAVEILEKGKHMALWINERIFHTAVLSLNLAHNLILSELYPDKPQILTTIINKPITIPLHVKINLADNQISHLRLPLTIGIVMPITMSCFIIGLVEERYSNFLTLQRIAGLRMSMYWLIGILWDFGTFFAFSVIYFLVMVVSTIEGFGTTAKLLTLLLMNVYGISALCFIYLLSLFMPNSEYRAFLIAIVVQFTIGLCAYIFYWDVADNSKVFYYFLSLSPTFSLLDGISNIYTENKEQEYCRDRCQSVEGCGMDNMCSLIPNCCEENYFKWSSPGILPSLSFMILSGLISSMLYALIYIYRLEKLHSTTPRIKEMGTVCFPSDDDEVISEKVRIANMSMRDCRKYKIVADQIEYRIPQHGKRLDTISFALKSNFSLAIYGGHHCGKSHLIQQLIGDCPVRFGEIYILGHDCKYEPDSAYQCVGYCPQDQGLCNAFTPRQLLTLLFMIRGIPDPIASQKMRDISRSLNLRQYMGLRIAFLPPNVRRKLNIAISLIVCNQVLILDEPTRGMSPLDCQLIWNVLLDTRSCDTTIIFCSSDSFECEVLADKLMIVDKGELLALGSANYLRKKYTKGFYLDVRLLIDGRTFEETEENLENDIENLMTYVKFLHEDSILISKYHNTLKFYIPLENIIYSYIFGSLEKNRRRLNISDYTIRQPSLLTALDNILAKRLLRDPYRKKRKIYLQESDDDCAKRYPDRDDGLQTPKRIANPQEINEPVL
ncbi:phospholipid-transporting ATPase ABCA3 [Haematobia irritans]|uniref:phospholipid-transporting ATPase ABCA3 n=1 Tax=Haematobia irritans TaxID=7368 RepID=UPI003F50CCBE